MAEGISGADRASQNAHMNMLLEKGGTSAEKKAAVKKGDIDFQQESLRITSKQHAGTEALKDLQKAGEQLKPALPTPDDLSTNQMMNANKMLGDLSRSTDKAMESTKQLFNNILNGSVTQGEAAKLKSHAAVLDDTASYMELLSGKGVETAEGKRQVLAGMGGFHKFQLDNLEQLSGSKDITTFLAAQHGGAKGLDQKTAILRSLGYSDSQIKTLMSLAPPDTDGSRLDMMRAAGSDVKAVLQALGFADAAEGLAALMNGQHPKLGSAEQKQLLAKMGFSDQEIEVILLSSHPTSLKNQAAMMRSSPQGLAALLRANSTGMNLLATGKTFEDLKILEQLVDIFAVMELLFKMSATQRSQAREFRAVNYEAARNEILNQADEMKKAALMSAIGGWVSAGTKIIAGAASIGLAVKAGNAPNQGAMQQQVAVANGVSQVISASGDMIKAGTDYKAGMHQAQVKIHEAMQKTHDNAAQSESEFMNLHQDMQKTVLSKMDEIIRSWFETLKSTTRV